MKSPITFTSPNWITGGALIVTGLPPPLASSSSEMGATAPSGVSSAWTHTLERAMSAFLSFVRVLRGP